MRSWCVKVPREEGESIRKKLLEGGLLEASLKIRKDGDQLLIPITNPEALENMNPILEEFEERDVPETDYRKFVDISEELREQLPTSFDVVGDIAIIRLADDLVPYAGDVGDAMRKVMPRLRTVAMDRGVQGEFRVRSLEVVSGEPSMVTTHTEYGLRFKVDVSTVYFNPRLAGERRRVSYLVREGEVVIDMFAGVGPFSLMIAKYSSSREVHAIDINPDAIVLMRENIEINKVEGVNPLLGDARELMPDLPAADRIIMNLPHSAHEFLQDASLNLKPGGTIHLYAISERDEVNDLVSSWISLQRGKGIDLDLSRLKELKTYSPTMSVYSVDLVLTHRSCSVARE